MSSETTSIILKKALELKLKKVVSEVSKEEFKEIMGPVCKGIHVNMDKLHAILENQIITKSMADIDHMLKNENMEAKQAALKKIIEAAGNKDKTDKWRPTGKTVDEQLASPDMMEKLKRRENLKTAVKKIEEKEHHLADKVSEMRSKVVLIQERMEVIDKEINDNTDTLEDILSDSEKIYLKSMDNE